MGRTACTEPQCLYKGALYLTVELYLYSAYGPYGLYRVSVPVQGRTLPYSRAIPLLPLWAVRPVQSQCLYKGALYLTVELYLYSPYGLYGLYRASVPVQGCSLPLPYMVQFMARLKCALSHCSELNAVTVILAEFS